MSPTQHPDLLIVGGGVAGSALGTVAARAGLSVTIVEREADFRDRIRGESIHPWGMKEVDSLGLRAVLEKAGGIELPFWTRYRDAAVETRFAWSDLIPGTPGSISVRHPAMQEALLTAASEAGATVLRPATVHHREDGTTHVVTVKSAAGTVDISPRLLIGADGRYSAVRGWIGGTAQRDPIHHRIAGAIVSGLHLDPTSAHQAYFPGGFAMIFPQQGGTARIYYVCPTLDAERLQRDELPAALLNAMRPWLPDGSIGDWRSEGPAGFFPNSDIVVDRTTAPGVVLIGDAAGVNDPSQGHGLALAFHDVRALFDLLTDRPWDEVPEAFALGQRQARETLRQHAIWSAPLMTGTGPEADALRDQVERARAIDPSAGGFAPIFMTGPAGLVADAAARRHFLGEDLPLPGSS